MKETTRNKLKDSGIQWIGEIPEHWKVEKAKNLFSLRTSKGNDVLEHLAATQTHGMYPQRLLEGVVQVAINTDYTQFRTVHKNDYVISLRSFQGGFEISEYEGVCSPAYQVFYNQIPICHNYFKVLFKSVSFIEFMNSLTVGIREGKNIQFTDFARSYLPVPPLEEQERISTYLYEKCGEIDELIDVEQQMISDLESYRQAIITEAVTHGITPDVPTKDSNIPQIPLIPKNWVTTKIKFLSNLYSGSNITTEEITNSGYPVYGGNGLRGFYDRYNKDGEFVLIGRQGALCGNINYAYGKFWASEHAIVCHPLIEYHLIWFGELLRSMNLNQYSVAAAQPGLSVDKIKNLHIPVPPLAEQVEIGEYIQGKCSEIDELIKVKQEKIETLKQYRQSLIFEAVTGKITIA